MYAADGLSEPITHDLHPSLIELLVKCNGFLSFFFLIVVVEILHFHLSPSDLCEALKNNHQNVISLGNMYKHFEWKIHT